MAVNLLLTGESIVFGSESAKENFLVNKCGYSFDPHLLSVLLNSCVVSTEQEKSTYD